MTASSDFLRDFHERGYFYQCTDEAGLGQLLQGKTPQVAYVGFDCTAPSLHVGSLVQIMALRKWQQSGNKPIVLLGGGTTRIGDPTGKDASRQVLSDAEIARNMEGIRKNFEPYLSFGDGPTDALLLDNDTWLGTLTLNFFLGTLGPLISVNKMLAKDSIRQRLERQQHLSFLEFNYMILQAYDFTRLYDDYACRVQMGGSDQWGNITAGVELHQKMQERSGDRKDIFGLTTPLIMTADGGKMGKTASGAVWLDAGRTSPYDFWQYWRNTADADVGRFLRLFTELPLEEIQRLEALEGAEINQAKIVLANEVTALLHGRDAAMNASHTARQTFEEGGAGDALPEITVNQAEAEKGIPAYDLFFRAGLAASNGEARRLIRGGGARINGIAVTSETHPVTPADFADGALKLSAGKKRHALARLAG